MKNIFSVVLFLFLSLMSYSQANKNWTMIHERTASWCSFCGGWGWSFKDQLIDGFKDDNVVFVAVHHSGDLANADAGVFDRNFGGSGQPIFFVDGVDIRATSNNRNVKFEETQLEVEFKKSAEVFAGVNLTSTYNTFNKELNAESEVEFYLDLEGNVNYYIGLYLLEDVMNIQAARTGIQLHKNVLRKSLLPEVFNNPIKSGDVKQGEKYKFSTTLPNLNGSPENFKVLAIIWTKPVDKYLFYNANIIQPEIINTSSTHEALNISFKTYQSESGDVVVNLGDSRVDEGKIIISDISGKILISKDILKNDTSIHNFSPIYTSGIHFVTIQQGSQKKTEKLFLY